MFQHFIDDVYVGVGQLMALVLDLGLSRAGQPVSFLIVTIRGNTPALPPTSSPNAIVVNKELGHFWASCPRVNSPTRTKVLYLVRGKASSPEASCPICSGVKVGGHLSLTCATTWHLGVRRLSSAAVMLSGPAHLCSPQQGQL